MPINFEQPMTTYELIAIILSILALVIPALKWLYDKFIKRLKIDFLPSGMITLLHNKSGSYITLGGVYEAKNKSTTIKEISAIMPLVTAATTPTTARGTNPIRATTTGEKCPPARPLLLENTISS